MTAASDSTNPSANSAAAVRIRPAWSPIHGPIATSTTATAGMTSRGPQLQPPIQECHVAASTNDAANSATSSAATARLGRWQGDERDRHEHERRGKQQQRLLGREEQAGRPFEQRRREAGVGGRLVAELERFAEAGEVVR